MTSNRALPSKVGLKKVSHCAEPLPLCTWIFLTPESDPFGAFSFLAPIISLRKRLSLLAPLQFHSSPFLRSNGFVCVRFKDCSISRPVCKVAFAGAALMFPPPSKRAFFRSKSRRHWAPPSTLPLILAAFPTLGFRHYLGPSGPLPALSIKNFSFL